jgi:hypothetical protein
MNSEGVLVHLGVGQLGRAPIEDKEHVKIMFVDGKVRSQNSNKSCEPRTMNPECVWTGRKGKGKGKKGEKKVSA